MFGKKKSPTVRIPNSILKREASKMAKKMLTAEKRNERNKLVREKAKGRATKKIAQKKINQSQWDNFYDFHLQREILGVFFVFLSILLSAIFFSDATLSEFITYWIQNLFGLGMWVLLVAFIGLGLALFLKKETLFPPARIGAFIAFFVSFCTLLNLLVSQEESLSLSHNFGGMLGFSFGFFPREFLGDFVSWIIFLALFWISGVIFFGIKISEIFSKKIFKEKTGKILIEKKDKKMSETTKTETSNRFQNEVEIIDSTKKEEKKSDKTRKLTLEEKDTLSEAKNKKFGEWEPPSLDLLKTETSSIVVDEKKLRAKADSIQEKLDQFGIEVVMKSIHVGPTVTQFTLEPSAGVKLTKITTLKADLALALAAENVRIEAPIRGKKLVGIEIPNEKRAVVGMREILESEPWEKEKSNLKLALGRDVSGKPIVTDLTKMPHLLIAGKTGSGKSVAMNAFLTSLLWNNSPEDLRMILVDPKRVELAPYNHLPHLLTPVIVEPEKSVSALAWAVAEMNRRYKDFSKKRCRNISEYNEKNPDKKEPYIVIVIDELADLMMVAGKDVEAAICRIAQMARAVGMHLIVATQRPSVDVVTGLIKANLPARIAFKVSSGIDSRTIIDSIGAEDLLGFGDMLNLDGNTGQITRVQGLYVSTEEVEKITNNIKLQFPESIGNDEIREEITNQSIEGMAKGGVLTASVGNQSYENENLDAKFEDAVKLVLETRKASASFLQRRMEIGYARAARLLDQMESKNIIGPARGAKAREIYGRND